MTAKEILSWARKGLQHEQDELNALQYARSARLSDRTKLALAAEAQALKEWQRQLEALEPLAPPLLPGDEVWSVLLDEDENFYFVARDRVTGVGFKGFTLSEITEDPEDMSAVVEWDLRDAYGYFFTRAEAQAAADSLNGSARRREVVHD